MNKKITFLKNAFRYFKKSATHPETQLLALGKLLSNQQYLLNSSKLTDYEFKIFSQWGDDGIIQYILKQINIENKTFIEFGVEDYSESNTRFLLMNNDWSGYVIDGSEKAMKNLKEENWFWKYDLRCKCAFIDKDNINELLDESGFSNLGILSIDIDGNDYHIFEEIDLTTLNPSVIIAEYNSVFGAEKTLSVPYKKDFYRTASHYSNLYFGASISALNYLAEKRGYSLIGGTSSGNNIYFLRNDLLNSKLTKKSVQEVFVAAKSRESRGPNGNLTLLPIEKRLEQIKGLPVLNVVTNALETI